MPELEVYDRDSGLSRRELQGVERVPDSDSLPMSKIWPLNTSLARKVS